MKFLQSVPPDLEQSPLFWLGVLASAKKSRDRLLEQVARQRLADLGVRVVFEEGAEERGRRRE